MKSKLLLMLVCVFGVISAANIYAADSEATILMHVEPRYPHHTTGEGWVKLSFDINTNGEPENIKILDAEPKRVFERSARKALSKWRYKPAIKGGKVVPQTNNEITLEFRLEE